MELILLARSLEGFQIPAKAMGSTVLVLSDQGDWPKPIAWGAQIRGPGPCLTPDSKPDTWCPPLKCSWNVVGCWKWRSILAPGQESLPVFTVKTANSGLTLAETDVRVLTSFVKGNKALTWFQQYQNLVLIRFSFINLNFKLAANNRV